MHPHVDLSEPLSWVIALLRRALLILPIYIRRGLRTAADRGYQQLVVKLKQTNRYGRWPKYNTASINACSSPST
jgi:hypothetical protein